VTEAWEEDWYYGPNEGKPIWLPEDGDEVRAC